jgi:hypothetical protein
MPLPSIQQAVPETLENAKLRIETEVTAIMGLQDIIEIEVPYEHHQTLRTWVQDEGMRCGCQVLPGRRSILVINTTLPPLPEPTPEQVQAQIEAVLAAQYAQEVQQLTQRVATLESEIVTLQGGS